MKAAALSLLSLISIWAFIYLQIQGQKQQNQNPEIWVENPQGQMEVIRFQNHDQKQNTPQDFLPDLGFIRRMFQSQGREKPFSYRLLFY